MTTRHASLSFALLVLASACGGGSDDALGQPQDGATTSAGGSSGKGGAAGAKTSDAGAGGTSSGGAKNTGGSPGLGGAQTFDAAPPVVRPCSNLPASGQWENITPPGDIGDSQAIRVHPTESGTLYVDMHKGGNGNHYPTDGLYRSTDCGATWSDRISTGKNSDQITNGSWWSFEIDPRNDQVIYAIDGYGVGGFFKSVNGGVDWEQTIPQEQAQYIPGLFLSLFDMDPTMPDHLAGATHQNCVGPTGGGCLVETMDGGTTWAVIKSPATGWIEGAGTIVLGPDLLLFAAGGGSLSVTTDHGRTWTKKYDSAHPSVLKTPNGTYIVPTNGGLAKSTNGLDWEKVQTSTSPRLTQIAGGKTHLYASDQWTNSFYVAPVDAPEQMQKYEGIPNHSDGTFSLAYDDGHGILYSSQFANGLWRVVTR